MEGRTKFAIIGTVIAILAICIWVGVKVVEKYKPNEQRVDIEEYYSIPEGEIMLFVDGSVYERNALYIDEHVYIELELVNDINYKFYWDDNENILIFTTATEIIKAETGKSYYYINKTKKETTYPIVRTVNGEVYAELEFVGAYSDMQYKIYQTPNRVVLNYRWGDYLYSDVKKATQLRVSYDIKSEILVNLDFGDKLMLVDAGGTQKNGFIKVMTADGIRGYVQTKYLSESYYSEVASDYTEEEYSHIEHNGSVNLAWHMTISDASNSYLLDMVSAAKGLNVVSPTWFNVADEAGKLDSRADETYVTQAHDMGLEVWGLFSNFHPNGEQDKDVDLYKLLSNTTSRENLVNEILAAAILYKLDGINIDFEGLKLEEGPHYIQFLRELSVKCRNNGIVLSVDNYVPAPYNAFYDLAEQGRIVDYVIIMAYDEHYVGSDAGSVSSISYVRNAISDALEAVPADRLVIALPFYTRQWKTVKEGDETKLTSETLGMNAAADILKTNAVPYTWNSECGQNYAEYEKDGATYKIWLEDEKSLEEKLKAVGEAKLAGAAFWRLGFEKNSVWSIIQKYVN